jgi:hypothetical protein
MRRDCNCSSKTKVNGSCVYGRQCRVSCVIYEAKCNTCSKSYIGNTQQKLKERMKGHFNDVQRLVNKNFTSDSFATHFASHCGEGVAVNADLVRKMVTMKVLWEGNPISCMKTFGKMSCSLCMKERETILMRSLENPKELINSYNEIYGACRHKTRFHRYIMNNTDTPSTDDGENTPERAPGTTSAKAARGDSVPTKNRQPLKNLNASQAMRNTVDV